MKSKKIVSVGDIVADIIFEFPSFPIQQDDFINAKGITIEAGGNSNFLIMASRLGMEAVALGAIGSDEWGKMITGFLSDENINIKNVVIEGTTTAVLVLVDQNGGHAFIGKYGEGSPLELNDEQANVIQQSNALFCSGYSLREGRISKLAMEAMRTANENNVQNYFDIGPTFDELSPDVKSEVLSLVDTLFLTEEELSGVTNKGVKGLFDFGPKIVVLKKGAKGCTVLTSEGGEISEPGITVEVKDTTAAGDSFDAGFITAMVNGWELGDCVKLGNAVGAAKVKKLGGGRNVPTLAEVREIIQEFGIKIQI
jgi:sugar/nucleoside kinase (ribokinase family)